MSYELLREEQFNCITIFLLGVVIYLDTADKEFTAPTVESMIKLL